MSDRERIIEQVTGMRESARLMAEYATTLDNPQDKAICEALVRDYDRMLELLKEGGV